jgi:lipoate-protein ligase A
MQQNMETSHENSSREKVESEQGAPDVVRLFGVQDIGEIDFFCHSPSESENDHFTAQENMDFDLNYALALARGEVVPMLRVYGWKPFAVSLGAHQRERDVDREACTRHGYEVVRRPTGGRAVLHAHELTYSLAVPLTTAQEPKRTMHDIYRDVHILLLKALQKLGARGLEFQKTQTDFRALYRTGQVSMPCFASSARYELMFEGRKVVGSAQKLVGDVPNAVVLQHGSILLGAGHEGLADVLRLSNDDEREAVRRVIGEQSATLAESAGREVSWDEVAITVSKVFQVNNEAYQQ